MLQRSFKLLGFAALTANLPIRLVLTKGSPTLLLTAILILLFLQVSAARTAAAKPPGFMASR